MRRETLFHYSHVERGHQFLEKQRGPESGEPRADDRDLGLGGAFQEVAVARDTLRQPVAGLLDGTHGWGGIPQASGSGEGVLSRTVRCCHSTVAPSASRLTNRIAVARTLICGGKAARRAPYT